MLVKVHTDGLKHLTSRQRLIDAFQCLLGDCYGEVGPPTEIRKAEYDSIRQAVFEQNAGENNL